MPASALSVEDAAWVYKKHNDTVIFHIRFDRSPALMLPEPGDSANGIAPLPTRYGDGFQLFLDADPRLPEDARLFPWETIARGVEASSYAGIPFRDALSETPSADPTSGGWGEVKGVADYTTTGTTLTFTVPNRWVGINGEAPALKYEIITLHDGTVQDTFVPTPTAALAGAVLLGFTALRRRACIER
jgi:hypothetical protein